MRCHAMRCDAMRCDAVRCDAMRCGAVRCGASQDCERQRLTRIPSSAEALQALARGREGGSPQYARTRASECIGFRPSQADKVSRSMRTSTSAKAAHTIHSPCQRKCCEPYLDESTRAR